MKNITVSITDGQAAYIKGMQRATGVSVSRIVRNAIVTFSSNFPKNAQYEKALWEEVKADAKRQLSPEDFAYLYPEDQQSEREQKATV